MRLAVPLAALVGAAACARRPSAGPAPVVPGCYELYVEDWPAAAAVETGLRTLPSYIRLDTTTAGPRGRRVIVPSTWEPEDPDRRRAYWRAGDAGPASLVLNFVGPSGDFTAALQPSRNGYMGEGVGLARGAARWPPEVHLQLMQTTCAGLEAASQPKP
jgi:hypothetical protein